MGWLNWIDPVAGAILAAAIIPPLILLYFLKLRRRTQPISCTILWKKSVEDLRANAPFQRLRKSLLLLLQLIALAMLILAIMQPQLRAGSRTGGRVVILIDNSASMAATDVDDSGKSRLNDAKEKAKNLVEALQSSGIFGGMADEAMVISFSNRAQVHCNFTTSRKQLISAIESIEQTDAATIIDEALKLARAHTQVLDPDNPTAEATGKPATLELFSDGNIADFSEQVRKGERLNYYPIGGERHDNIAFSGVSAERPYDSPGSLQVFASLLNFGDEAATCTVEMSVNNNIEAGWIKDVPISAASVDESTGRLVPGRSNVIFGPFAQPRDAVINVRNLREDDLRADNSAWMITPPPKNLRVAFVAPDLRLTTDAVRGMHLLQRLDVLTADEFAALVSDNGTNRYDVIVLSNAAPESLPPGRYLSLAADLPIEALAMNDPAEGFEVADWEREHAILRYVNLDRLVIRAVRPLASTNEVRVLAEAASGLATAPVLVEYSDRNRHIVHLTFKPIDSNWIWQQSFVIFMVNALEYLSTVGDAAADRDLRPNEPIVTQLPAVADDITIALPGGEVAPIETTDPTSITWARTPHAGFYEIAWKTNGASSPDDVKRFAVNLFDEHESQIAPASELKWGDEIVTSEGESGALQTPLWPWAIALCLLVLMLEWWVYHRKTYL